LASGNDGGQLADQDDERDAVQIAGQDRLRQKVAMTEPGRAGDRVRLPSA
jgi:hypothetical protein